MNPTGFSSALNCLALINGAIPKLSQLEKGLRWKNWLDKRYCLLTFLKIPGFKHRLVTYLAKREQQV